MTRINTTLITIITATALFGWPARDYSEGGAIWVGDDNVPDIRTAVETARKVFPHLVRVPCGTFFMDLPDDFWSSGVTIRGNGPCTMAIVPQDQYGI